MTVPLEARIMRSIIEANNRFGLIASGDRILLAFSGGKDSFGLLHLLFKAVPGELSLKPSPALFPVLIDPGFPDSSWRVGIENARRYIEGCGSTLIVEKTNIFEQAHAAGNRKNPCFLCARMRRTRLHELAERLGCSKIAMGHHRDDVIETLLLNIFFSREISTMLPRQETFGGKFTIIRPLALVEERLMQQYAWRNAFPAIENPCPERVRSKRRFIKELLARLEQEEPGIKHNIFRSLQHVKSRFLW